MKLAVKVVLVFTIIVSLYLRVYALVTLPIVGDEVEDSIILKTDSSQHPDFFENVRAPSQSRLPFEVTTPIVNLLELSKNQLVQNQSLIPTRLLFFVFNGLFLFICYKISRAILKEKTSSQIFLLFLITSSYLSSFSIFTLTTSDSMFLAFAALSFYLFYKSCMKQNQTGVFVNPMMFAIVMALAIASKLTGVLFLIGYFIFHVVVMGTKKLRVSGMDPMAILKINLFTILGILIVNALDIFSPAEKVAAVLLIVCAYVLLLTVQIVMAKRSAKSFEVPVVTFWAVIVSTCFLMTIAISPIYININNVLGAVGWFSEFGGGEGGMLEGSKFYDLPFILLVKFGLISTFLLIIPTAIFIKERLYKKLGIFSKLSLVIFIIYFTATSLVKHTVVWYGLPIFAFLYLPFVWLWDYAFRMKKQALILLALFCALVVIGDNTYRYLYWYPYGHFDGAQYGEQYIRWDRPGFVTFEVLPPIHDYLMNYYDQSDKQSEVRVATSLSELGGFNEWATTMLNEYTKPFKKNFRVNYYYVSNDMLRENDLDYDLILTSPIYNKPSDDRMKLLGGYFLEKQIVIKNIRMASIWRKKPR